ncbi:hypothetical protein AAG565_08575 [Fontimonas sp. SYSU GA230001]|uniref:hypothetical protein n=1 Tax=Fontimonas sp. SYSU GA230001 TaxID=3142450 RepID=UPI0032B3193E
MLGKSKWRQPAWCALGAALLVSGCIYNPVAPVGQAVRESLVDGISDEMRGRLIHLRGMEYALLYMRLPDRREAAFILAERGGSRAPDVWVGGDGVSIGIDAPYVNWTSGFANDVEFLTTVRSGALRDFLQQGKEFMFPGAPAVMWGRRKGYDAWIEQIAWNCDRQEVYYRGLAYEGPALLITECVETTGRPGHFERKYWIDTRRRAVLRMTGPIWADSKPLYMEWVRVPDPAER